jgi:nucleoside-diphosphate-sugar epimerase
MKILITGNMGYVGPAAVRQLRETNGDSTLVGLDTGYFAHCLTAAEFLPECQVDVQYFADIRRFPRQALANVDVVVHLAGISNDPIGNRFESVTTDINLHASAEFAQVAKANGVKAFVFASSCSMYGLADDRPRTEQSPLNPLTAYAKSKVGLEERLRTLADRDFSVTCLRFATACGMSPRLRLDLVVNDFVACAMTSRNITILSDGTPWRPLIHVDDMARAIDWAVQRDYSHGQSFLAINVGANRWNYQVRELAEAVANVIPGVEISINPNAPVDKRSYRVDFALYEELAPDHQPQVDLTSAILGLKEGLQRMEFRNAEFRNSQYMRLKVLTSLMEGGVLDSKLEWAQTRRCA